MNNNNVLLKHVRKFYYKTVLKICNQRAIKAFERQNVGAFVYWEDLWLKNYKRYFRVNTI